MKEQQEGNKLLNKQLRNYLMSSFCINARVISSIAAIRKKLESYPGLSLIAQGTSLKYELSSGASDYFYVLELGKNSLCFFIYSLSSPLYLLHDALLKLLNVLVILYDDYFVDVRSLFPYLAAVLARQQYRTFSIGDASKSEHNSEVDYVLAKRVSALLSENYMLKRELDKCASRAKRTALMLIIAESAHNANVKQMADLLGVSKDGLLELIASLPELGYKAVYRGADEFELVKL